METKFIQNLILKSMLIVLFFVMQCSSFEKSESLIFRNSNLAIYQSEDPDNSNKQDISADLLSEIFSSFQKKKNLLGNREYYFKRELYKDYFVELASRLKPKLKFFIILKEDDSLSPYTRFQKHSFNIVLRKELILIRFQELENFYNVGNKVEFQDWAIPYFEETQCAKEAKIFFQNSGIDYGKNPSCKNQKDYSLIQIDLTKFGKNIPSPPIKKTADQRLEELLNLYKKGYITKDDYELKKAEVLGEL